MLFHVKNKTDIRQGLLLFQYILVHGAFWTGYVGLYSFASIYLGDKGYDSGKIGLILAAASLCGIFFQPMITGLADKYECLTPQHLVAGAYFLSAMAALALYKMPSDWAIFPLVFILGMVTGAAATPLLNAINIYYVNAGIPLNYGIARGSGSLIYAITTTVMGNLIAARGVDIACLCTAGCFLLGILAAGALPLLSTRKEASEGKQSLEKADTSEEKQSLEKASASSEKQEGKTSSQSGTIAFLLHYKKLTLCLVGIILVYFFYSAFFSFMIYHARNVGGDTTTVGYVQSIGAIVELPAMFGFSYLVKRFSCRKLLKFSVVFFVIKALLLLLATSPAWLYGAHLLQCLSYAIFLPATVYYANEQVEEQDQFKAQAIMTAATTMSAMLASLVGGLMIENLGLGALNLFGFVLALIGAVLVFVFA